MAATHVKRDAKRKFKKLMNGYNMKVCKLVFDQWYGHKEEETKKILKKKQKKMTSTMQETVDEQGTTEDKIFEQEKQFKEAQRSEKSLALKTLKKTITQWKLCQSYEAFVRWKEYMNKNGATEKSIGHTIFLRLHSKLKYNAFLTWRKNMHVLD